MIPESNWPAHVATCDFNSDPLLGWSVPEQGSLNTDGSLPEDGSGGTAAILCDHMGDIILGPCRHLFLFSIEGGFFDSK